MTTTLMRQRVVDPVHKQLARAPKGPLERLDTNDAFGNVSTKFIGLHACPYENKIIANNTKYATFVKSGRARFNDCMIVCMGNIRKLGNRD